MAEWSKAHDWKSCVRPKRTVSSNLTLSAIYTQARLYGGFLLYLDFDVEPFCPNFDDESLVLIL